MNHICYPLQQTILHLHDDGARFQGADGVPLADGDVHGDYRATGREFDGLGAAALCNR